MTENQSAISDNPSQRFWDAAGPIRFGFTNDLYSDKFALGVADLPHIELATDEDKTYGER